MCAFVTPECPSLSAMSLCTASTRLVEVRNHFRTSPCAHEGHLLSSVRIVPQQALETLRESCLEVMPSIAGVGRSQVRMP